eukprot:TRINITY_DN45344_c0_g1_i3.p1 TRINITY_DN45344_c0_g1~~TRINITY_DN45344_c0_g1_i3.p1  ORF type:complete len:495 (-),score=113.66 TRINITY_DN45344_c0_g1_i3:613-2097(-)
MLNKMDIALERSRLMAQRQLLEGTTRAIRQALAHGDCVTTATADDSTGAQDNSSQLTPDLLCISGAGACSGCYEKDVLSSPTGLPLWRSIGDSYVLFHRNDSRWVVGGPAEEAASFKTKSGFFATAAAHKGVLPESVPPGGWLVYDAKQQQWVSAKSLRVRTDIPKELQISGEKRFRGAYDLVSGEFRNGFPVWKLRGRAFWIFSGSTGQWFVGDEEQQQEAEDEAFLACKARHRGLWPHEMAEDSWLAMDEESGDWQPIALTLKQPPTSVTGTPRTKASTAKRQDDLVRILDAPKALHVWVAEECSGLYEFVPPLKGAQYPTWKQHVGGHIIFMGRQGRWTIGRPGGGEADDPSFVDAATAFAAFVACEMLWPHEVPPDAWCRYNAAQRKWERASDAMRVSKDMPRSLYVVPGGQSSGCYFMAAHSEEAGAALHRHRLYDWMFNQDSQKEPAEMRPQQTAAASSWYGGVALEDVPGGLWVSQPSQEDGWLADS